MKKISFEEALQQILDEDSRYDEHAYLFIREALDHTIKALAKPTEGPGRHVTGGELLEGIREFALNEYGPMTYTILKKWGVNTTEDMGELVFNLVDKGILGKTDEDRREDFARGYDFEEAFRGPYRPKGRKKKAAKKKSARKAT
ncbi:MAG: Minf_1886 family protein [Verrucomicrobiota bacterium]